MIAPPLRRTPRVVHPLLFAVAPVVSLYAANPNEWAGIEPKAILGPVALTLVIAMGLYTGLRLEVGAHKAGLVVSWLLLLFFSFGHLRIAMGAGGRAAFPVLMHLAVWAALFAVGARFALGRRSRPFGTTRVLNASALGLVLVPVLGVTFALGGIAADAGDVSAVNGGVQPLRLPDDPPDVYVLVLDEYANAAVLTETYGYDNGPFLDALRERGFAVSEDSLANYAMTYLSLSATLNLGYLDGLPPDGGYEPASFSDVTRLMRESAVARSFTDSGYRFVLVASGWGPTDASPLADEVVRCGRHATEFERNLGDTTVLRAFEGRFTGHARRAQVNCAFEALAGMPERHGPQFVFAHMLTPHRPFVFDADGGPVDALAVGRSRSDVATRERLYVAQLQHVNTLALRWIDGLLARDPGAVILLQSDTGPGGLGAASGATSEEAVRERMRNLNAARVPGVGLDDTEWAGSSVNTFRALFDLRFGTAYGPLPDRAWLSTYEEPFRVRDVTDVVASP